MQEFPHRYFAAALANPEGEVDLESKALPSLVSAPPSEFGGPGNLWSPETLLVGAVADCFVLTFRAIARASRLPWTSLKCEVEGTLDRIDGVTQFTEFMVRASLRVPAGTDEKRAQRLLERSEQTCLITNSLKAKCHLSATIDVLSS